jgi:hypothetical protein
MYENETQQLLIFSNQAFHGKLKLAVFDHQGRIVISEIMYNESLPFSRKFRLKNPSSGLYLVWIDNGTTQRTYRVIVQ